MKKYACLLLLWTGQLYGQSIDPVSLLLAKAIKAIDLSVQRLQHATMVKQVAQQAMEKEMGRVKLADIAGWHYQLASLYAGYFAELGKVKTVVSGSTVAQRILACHQQVVNEYRQRGNAVLLKEQYDGLLSSGTEVLQTLPLVLGSRLSMRDAERISVLHTLQDAMDRCLEGMKALNRRQADILSRRTKMHVDNLFVKRLHGTP